MPDAIILHVGPHKTGSTAIQRMLDAARDELRAEGIVYPATGIVAGKHHGLYRFCAGKSADLDPGQLLAEVAGARLVVISSEDFADLDVDGLAKLRALLPKVPIRVVYYLRCLCDLWPSHWQETIRHGQTWPFPEYVLRQSSSLHPSGWWGGSQFDQLSQLAASFGRHAVEIVGYDGLRADGADIGRHFQTAILGRNDAAVTGTAPVAKGSLKDWQLELIRALNAIHRSRVQGPADDTIRKLAMRRLGGETPRWLEELKALVAAAPRFELGSEQPFIAEPQVRVLGTFARAIVGDAEAAAAAYTAARRRQVPLFELPLAGSERLRRALLDHHLELVGASGMASSPAAW